MVNFTKGTLVTCTDEAMKEFVLYLEETERFGLLGEFLFQVIL